MKYRPNTVIMYFYGFDCKAYVTCHPQSRWELVKDDGIKVTLKHKNVTIDLKRADFEKQWKKVEG